MRIHQITFTRFVAAISIVIFHFGGNVFPFKEGFIAALFRQANIGVSYFFILSGFVMVIAYKNKKEVVFSEYLWSRIARIYPIYLLSLILYLIYLIASHKTATGTEVLLYSCMLQPWVPGYALALNYPGWSVGVEMFFYSLFPFLLNKVYSRISFKNIFYVVTIFFLVSQIVFSVAVHSSFYQGHHTKSQDLLFYFPPMHLSEFLLGNLAGLYFIKRPAFKIYDFHILSLAVLLIVLLNFDFGINYHNGILAIIFVPFILLLAWNTGWIASLFKSSILIFLGEISFGIYMLQLPVFIWVGGLLRFLHIESAAMIFYCSLVTLVIIAALSHQFIEIPVSRALKKLKMPAGRFL